MPTNSLPRSVKTVTIGEHKEEEEKEREEHREEHQADVRKGIPENTGSWDGAPCLRPDVPPVREQEYDARGRKPKATVSWDVARQRKKDQTHIQFSLLGSGAGALKLV